MFIQRHQLPEIMSPKKGCQRGLEEYIVDQHWGDKKLYHQGGGTHAHGTNPNADHSYMYFNNPIYRVGKEGDPAPDGLSSRHIYQIGDNREGLSETESALHLLYPTIDSGSEHMYEKPWDMDWYYSRTNIPNVFASPQQVAEVKDEMMAYDDSVERKRTSNIISDWMARPLPIYDQDRINDEALPDGVRQIQLGDVRTDKPIPIVGNTPGKHQQIGVIRSGAYVRDSRTIIENYTPTNLTGGTNTSPSAGIGAYGYPKPYGYASVGASRHHYDVFPGYVPGVNVEYYTNTGISDSSGNFMWICAIIFIGILFFVIRKK
jgi:hypothetical protein